VFCAAADGALTFYEIRPPNYAVAAKSLGSAGEFVTGLATIGKEPVRTIAVATGSGKIQLWDTSKEKQTKALKEQSIVDMGKTLRVIGLAASVTHVVCAIEERPAGEPRIVVLDVARIGAAPKTFPTPHKELRLKGVRFTCIAIEEATKKYVAGTLTGEVETGSYVPPYSPELLHDHVFEVGEGEAKVTHCYPVNCIALSDGKFITGGGAPKDGPRVRQTTMAMKTTTTVEFEAAGADAVDDRPPATACAIGEGGKIVIAVGDDWSRGRNAPESWKVGLFVCSKFTK
jgi:hypothetical protein